MQPSRGIFMSRAGFPQSSSSTEHVSGEFYDKVTGAQTSSYSFGASYTSYSADKVGPNSPGFPAHKDETNYLAYNNRMSMDKANFVGDAYYNNTRGAGSWPMSYITPLSDPAASYFTVQTETEAEAYQKCVNKLISNVKNQKVNVANFAAEFKQTAGLISSTANRIASAFGAVKRGNVAGAVRVLAGGSGGSKRTGRGSHGGKTPGRRSPRQPSTGSVARDWLSLQYGWVPLLSDINGACEELANHMTYQPPVYRATGSGKSERSFDQEFSKFNPIYPPTRASVKSEVTCNGVIEYRVRAEWADLARTTGLINPLATAWELLPYSFVVDWFVPVGNFLNNLDYDLGVEFSRGWISTHAQHSFTVVAIGGPQDDGNQTFTWSGGRQHQTVTGYRRTPLGSFPSVPAPSFKDPLSLRHVENALALLRTVFDR